jgi:hypothetical protein
MPSLEHGDAPKEDTALLLNVKMNGGMFLKSKPRYNPTIIYTFAR